MFKNNEIGCQFNLPLKITCTLMHDVLLFANDLIDKIIKM